MTYEYVTAKCVKCGKTLYFKITKIFLFIRSTTGLGPNVIVCPKCGTEMQTPFREWGQMNLRWRIWYVVLSVVHATVIGLMCALPIVSVYARIYPAGETEQSTVVAMSAGFFALCILLAQTARVLRSLERGADVPETKMKAGLWNWETNFQFFGMLLILLAVAGGAITLI
jgi:hypothetical protein